MRSTPLLRGPDPARLGVDARCGWVLCGVLCHLRRDRTVFRRAIHRISPSMAVSLLALFVALGGVGYSATGGTFILGQTNTATSQSSLSSATPGKTLVLTNTDPSASSKALALNVPSGHPPFEVNSGVKVASLNADRLDDLHASAFTRFGVTQTGDPGVGAGGLVDVINTGSGNGVEGRTSDAGASGVYGSNTGGSGYGVAGRAGISGVAVLGDNTGGGVAGQFNGDVNVSQSLSVGGAVACAGCVNAGNISGRVNDSEKLDGMDSSEFIQGPGRVFARRVDAFYGLSVGIRTFNIMDVSYACPATPSDAGVLTVNAVTGPLDTWIENGTPTPTYAVLQTGGGISCSGTPAGDLFHVQAQATSGNIMTIDIATVHRPSVCSLVVQATLSPSS